MRRAVWSSRIPGGGVFRFGFEDVEREVIARVLRKHQGNVSQTARELGLTRTALYRRMEKYGL